MTSGTVLAPAAALARARRARAEADAAEVEVVRAALAWAEANTVVAVQDAATWGDAPVPLAGEGAPQVSEFCVAELAAALGLSTDSGRRLMAHALELGHRLPRVWARVQDGALRVWRARQIAEKTLTLSPEAAAHVDAQAAPFAARMSLAALQRLIESAMARYMPQEAERIAEDAADSRHVTIEPDAAFTGLGYLTAQMDLPDALDLDHALQAGAARLKDLGCTEPLDVRRSIALGALARQHTHGQAELDGLERDITLYVHLTPGNAPGTAHPTMSGDVALLENAGTHLLTPEQVRTWCGNAHVTLKPVIDLAETLTTDAYKIPDRIREQVILRDRTCVFPWCERNARACDLDHVVPHDQGGATSGDNLAPLCRRHHRHKTFGSWTYTVLEPGTFLWRSPHGYAFLRDRTGTRDLTPRPVDPPG